MCLCIYMCWDLLETTVLLIRHSCCQIKSLYLYMYMYIVHVFFQQHVYIHVKCTTSMHACSLMINSLGGDEAHCHLCLIPCRGGESIRVFVRVRPPDPNLEEGCLNHAHCLEVNSTTSLSMQSRPEPKVFTFDHVAGMHTTQVQSVPPLPGAMSSGMTLFCIHVASFPGPLCL